MQVTTDFPCLAIHRRATGEPELVKVLSGDGRAIHWIFRDTIRSIEAYGAVWAVKTKAGDSWYLPSENLNGPNQ